MNRLSVVRAVMIMTLAKCHAVVRLFASVLLAACFSSPIVAAEAAYMIEIKGPIGPGVADHVTRGLEEAQQANAPLVILKIDTPGGLVSSTRDIIKAILAHERPVVGYVAPSGSRAASAGAYILLACHVAVMAPGTNVGSATPVMMGGSPGGQPQAPAQSEHPDITDKVMNDARAYMRAISEMRGRPGNIAEQFVSEASNLTAQEAIDIGLIDLVAKDYQDMLQKLDGWTIKIDNETIELSTSFMEVHQHDRTWRDELLVLITNPNVAYLLLMAGIYGLLIEFSNPGFVVPGVVGGVCLILGLYALQLLFINYAGLALIGLGIALMVTEAFVPAFGVLGVGGIVSFLIGSVMLIDNDVPDLQISPILIGTVSLATAALFLFVFTFAVRAWRRPAVSGNAAMLGTNVRVISWKKGQGTVSAHGEVWTAKSKNKHTVGDMVHVDEIDGLTLRVSPASDDSKKETTDNG